jgi:aspartyl-tRNA(Asn)/glutamyl-tRNA(Gln) amidotransferase subunit C
MKVSIETIEHIAKLAKLKFEAEEMGRFVAEFDHILEHFANLEQEDLSGIDAKSFESKESVFREDIKKEYGSRKELFRNAKTMRDTYILIPKVMD